MDKDRAKLAKLRKTKADAKAKQHQELVKSNQSVKEAIVELHQVINGKAAFNDEQIVEQLKLLASNMTFKDEIAKLETAIVNKAKQPIELKNIEQLIDVANPSTVVDAINSMAVKLEANPTSQKADDYLPYRRVIKVGSRFVFDDDKMNVNVMGGGGGGGGSSVQMPLVRDTDDGQAVAVVNPDGTPVGGSSDGLTDAQLRATPVPVSKDKSATSTQTQVSDSATSVTILAANSDRIRATIVNDSTEILYLRESSTAATTTNYSWKVQPDGTVVIDDYTGQLTGIWASDGSGQATVSEVA